MKKAFWLVLLFITPYLHCHSQVSLSIASGVNFPMGNFSSKNVEMDGAGMAMVGINAEISGGIPIHRNIGTLITLRGQWNKFDTKPMEDYPSPISAPGSVTVNADQWKSFFGLVGPYYEFPVSNRVTIGLKAQAGIAVTNFPEVEIIHTISQGFVLTEYNKYSAESASSFAFLGGAYVKMKIAERFSLGVSADYLQTSQDFTLEMTSMMVLGDDETEEVVHGPRDWQQEIRGINAIISLSYSFKRK